MSGIVMGGPEPGPEEAVEEVTAQSLRTGCRVITVTHRGQKTWRHVQNVDDIVKSLVSAVHPYVIEGKGEIPASVPQHVATDGSPVYVLRIVDTSNVTQLRTFEDHVRLCASSHVIIAEHGAFHSNLIFMRQHALMIDLRGNYNNPATVTFEQIAEMFGVYYKNVVTKGMLQHNQDSFVVAPNEVTEIRDIVLEYFRQG